eukprot:scaffold278508_cov17-Tisochrysis_lutea.AAC.1
MDSKALLKAATTEDAGSHGFLTVRCMKSQRVQQLELPYRPQLGLRCQCRRKHSGSPGLPGMAHNIRGECSKIKGHKQIRWCTESDAPCSEGHFHQYLSGQEAELNNKQALTSNLAERALLCVPPSKPNTEATHLAEWKIPNARQAAPIKVPLVWVLCNKFHHLGLCTWWGMIWAQEAFGACKQPISHTCYRQGCASTAYFRI